MIVELAYCRFEFEFVELGNVYLLPCVCQVAASHLDTVLEKLKDILDNVGQSFFQRYIADCVLIMLFIVMICLLL